MILAQLAISHEHVPSLPPARLCVQNCMCQNVKVCIWTIYSFMHLKWRMTWIRILVAGESSNSKQPFFNEQDEEITIWKGKERVTCVNLNVFIASTKATSSSTVETISWRIGLGR